MSISSPTETRASGIHWTLWNQLTLHSRALSQSIPLCFDALEDIALRRVDGQNQFRHRCCSSHEALVRIEVDGALISPHSVGFASHPLQEIASTMRPTWLIRLLSFDQLVKIERFVEAPRFERLAQVATKIRRVARSSQH